jgi:hypothetical protein
MAATIMHTQSAPHAAQRTAQPRTQEESNTSKRDERERARLEPSRDDLDDDLYANLAHTD